ncbi:MAG: YgiT-type zinc finger protein [Magnetococcales bacterium]|nr:YgiT-type zinc finger protein [Magnetococcales bacterium]
MAKGVLDMTGKCPFCGHRNMVSRQVEYLYRSDEGFLVVTGVPCLECEFVGSNILRLLY